MNNEPIASSNLPRFRSLRDTRPEPATWQSVFQEITDGTHATATARYRTHLATLQAIEATGDTQQLEQWKLAKSNLKSAQLAFIPSVHLEGGRSSTHIKGFTRFIMVDIDEIADERMPELLHRVKTDAHSFLAYTTLSGHGIRIICRIEGEVNRTNYRTAWEAVNNYYAHLCGVEIDAQCKNATRMSALCHDPDALFRPEAAPFKLNEMKLAGKQPGKQSQPRKITPERAYKTIRKQLEEEGIAYLPGNHNNYISRCCYSMNRYGVPKADTEAWATRAFPDYPHGEVLAIVKSCYMLTKEFNTISLPRPSSPKEGDESQRRPKATVEEMEAFIAEYMEIRMNALTHQIETRLTAGNRWERLTDHTENSLWCAMQRSGMKVNINELHTLITSDYVKEHHPFRHYLDKLPPWDGKTDYISRFAETVHTKKRPCTTPDAPAAEGAVHFVPVFKRWLVAMIASALDESVVNQVILTLIGRQGSYKTSFMQHILPPELSEYYTVKSNSNRITKDDLFTMTENLIINLEEIDTMPPSELNQLKAMVTQRYVDERPPYGRNKVHLPHVASFVATGNNLQFLTDDTGNRRWLPFEVELIDNPWEAEIPYDNIYSQAYALYHDVNFRYWFDDEEIQRLRGHVQQFEVPRPEYELILTYYRKPVGLERGFYITTSQLINRLGSTSLRLSPQKVGRSMRELGFQQVKASNANYWVVVERTSEEVQHLLPDAAEGTDDAPS